MQVGDLVEVTEGTGFELTRGFISRIKKNKSVVRQYNGKDTLQVTDLVLVRLFDGVQVWAYKENIKVLNKISN